eukprot:NODE_17458_length_941_cov_5.438575.p1 GENE.NODE_17458_length_941_cov_5.438575~~NODE_17458_length_941_cov_5.438575.p1  ORF type:complete len:208 (+),score=30.52 NODE_17458_length_941_cov_5.438575:31-654(+)
MNGQAATLAASRLRSSISASRSFRRNLGSSGWNGPNGSCGSTPSSPLQQSLFRNTEVAPSARHAISTQEAEVLPERRHSQTAINWAEAIAVFHELRSDYTRWWIDWCQHVMQLANIFHWLSVFFNVLCCAILLGMYFAYNYFETPWMWRSYVGVLGMGLLVGFPLTLYCIFCGGLATIEATPVRPPGRLVPTWMTAPQEVCTGLGDG